MQELNELSMIGIGCVARSGKDTLFKILDSLCPDKLERVALADLLKHEMDDFCKKNYGISAFTKDPLEKEIIRDMFVSHGKVKRLQHKGKYWTGLVQERVDNIIKEGLIPVCTDIRYSIYPEDEIFWLKVRNNGVYIQVDRYNKDGSKIEPANVDEKEQEKILEQDADYRLSWNTSDDLSYLEDVVKAQLKGLLDRIYKKYGIV
jgi:hypothetical protein